MGGSLCNGTRADHEETGEKKELMHPPSIVEMKHGHICKHSKIFLEQQLGMDTVSSEKQCRKGAFYHPKIETLDTHPARMNKYVYTVYGGATQDQGRCVYLIDEYKK